VRILAVTLALITVIGAAAAQAADPRAEKVRLRPADVALAKRAVLTQDDVGPDWARFTAPKTKDGQFACSTFRPDFSAFTVTGEATSSYQITSQPSAQIDSSVAVFLTKSQAARDFRLGAKPGLAGCLADQVRRAFRGYPKSVRGKVISSKMVAAPKVGELSAAYALTASLTGNGVSIPVFVDVIATQRGRSIAVLIFTGLSRHVPSRPYYAGLVVDRLR
jgi:hypothetical protein